MAPAAAEADAPPLKRPPSLLHGAAPTAEELRRTSAEQLRIVCAADPGNLCAGLFAALFIMSSVWAVVPGSRAAWGALAWWLLLSLALLRGLRIARAFNAAKLDDDAALARAWRSHGSALLCASLWGSASWLMLPSGRAELDIFLIVAMAMIMSGAAAAQSVFRRHLKCFLMPLTAVWVTGLLTHPGLLYPLLAVAFVLLAGVILAAAHTQEDAVRAAIVYRVRTQRLLDEARERQAQTDRARAEAEAAREQAELANQGKTTFLAAASHDLRQPMHALVQYCGHLERRNRDPSLRETVSRISKSLDAMQDLLNAILEVSKLMMGAVKPQVAAFSLAGLLDRLDAQLRPLAEGKGLRFTVEDGVPATVQSDELLLERILRNLTLNAIRYTDAGEVLVRCRMVGRAWRVQVWDSGIGIGRAERGRIFEEFYQVGNAARDRRKGLGLGLSLVRQLCSLLGHPLRVRSRPGRGSVFSVELPIARGSVAPRAGTVADAAMPDYVHGSFVVLIDDDAACLEATAATLESFGCTVLCAASAWEAIERLQGRDAIPHLVLSDFRIGGGETGIDAIRRVVEHQRREFGEGFEIPALMVSGDTAPGELAAVQEAGYVMLHKPVRVEVLYDALNHELRTLATQGRGAG